MPACWGFNPSLFTTAQLPRFFRDPQGSVDAATTVAAGGESGGSVLTGSNLNAEAISIVRNSDTEYFRVGARVRVNSLPASPKLLLGVVDANLALQVGVVLMTSGTLKIVRGDSAADLTGPSVSSISTATWLSFGFRGRVSRTDGEAEVYVGDTVSDATRFCRVNNANTAQEDTLDWRGIYLGPGSNILMEHAYAFDGDGDTSPGMRVYIYRSSTRVVEIFNEWSSTEDTIPEAIDEATADDMASTIDANESGARFATAMETVPELANIQGVMPVVTLLNAADTSPPTTGMATFDFLAYLETVEYYGGWQSGSAEDWVSLWHMFTPNPRTSIAWTTDNLNAGRFGGRMAV